MCRGFDRDLQTGDQRYEFLDLVNPIVATGFRPS